MKSVIVKNGREAVPNFPILLIFNDPKDPSSVYNGTIVLVRDTKSGVIVHQTKGLPIGSWINDNFFHKIEWKTFNDEIILSNN